jgi:tRNA dimethylallyltransferase
MQSVGYRQVTESLASGGSVDQAALNDSIYRATRTFARRQRTWLRDQKVQWVGTAAEI